MNNSFAKFKQKIASPIGFRAFLLAKLPLVYFTGIKITSINPQQAVTTVSYKWLNQNPFRSLYFAVLNMAAELSTGVLCMGNIYGRSPISMLLIKTEGTYHKKAVGKISFTCNDGNTIAETIEKARTTNEGQTIKCYSVAANKDGEIVAEFWFTWSFKKK